MDIMLIADVNQRFAVGQVRIGDFLKVFARRMRQKTGEIGKRIDDIGFRRIGQILLERQNIVGDLRKRPTVRQELPDSGGHLVDEIPCPDKNAAIGFFVKQENRIRRNQILRIETADLDRHGFRIIIQRGMPQLDVADGFKNIFYILRRAVIFFKTDDVLKINRRRAAREHRITDLVDRFRLIGKIGDGVAACVIEQHGGDDVLQLLFAGNSSVLLG